MRKMSMNDYDIFLQVAKRYAQAEGTQLAPDEIQVGQSVFNSNGEELIVLESEDAATTKVLMPAEQLNTGGLPESVQTVDDVALGSDYTLQPDDAGVGVTAFHRVLPEFQEKRGKMAKLKEFRKNASEVNQLIIDQLAYVVGNFREYADEAERTAAAYQASGDLDQLKVDVDSLAYDSEHPNLVDMNWQFKNQNPEDWEFLEIRHPY